MRLLPPIAVVLVVTISCWWNDVNILFLRSWDDGLTQTKNRTDTVQTHDNNNTGGSRVSVMPVDVIHDSNHSPNQSNLVTRNRESRNKADENLIVVHEGDEKTPPNPHDGDCCFRPSKDVQKTFTPEYFELQRGKNATNVKWTGNEYEEWRSVLSRLNPNNQTQASLDCQTQYTFLVLDQVDGFYLRNVLTELQEGKPSTFPLGNEVPGLPRILLLGDSISRGIRVETQRMFHSLANIHGAPTNCLGFEKYKTGLRHWLGSCPWDIVQFNVGMHFRPNKKNLSWKQDYRSEIGSIVSTIRAHSPSAHIVFALTTPSPFDSNATMPNKATCPHYNRFHKRGFIPSLNEIAFELAKDLGVIINDRYSIIHPVVGDYQNECDVHYVDDGYQLLAKHEWELFSSILFPKDYQNYHK